MRTLDIGSIPRLGPSVFFTGSGVCVCVRACVRAYLVTTAHDLGNHEMAHIVAHQNADNILVVKGLALPESVLASMFTAE